MKSADTNNHLVWVDLETTGLDEKKDVILEVGIVVTDHDLNEIVMGSWVVDDWRPRPDMHPTVVAMHTTNGLFDDIVAGKGLLLTDVDALAHDLLHAFKADGGPICGSSIHFDRKFIERYMPRLTACFTHRCFDTSTLKQAYTLWKGDWPSGGTSPHRALADCRESIAATKLFKDSVFRRVA